jgi:hypothetical protein
MVAIAALKARAAQRASNLKSIVDDLRSRGVAGARAIAAELNNMGVVTARGATWHPTSAARLLLDWWAPVVSRGVRAPKGLADAERGRRQ